MDAEQTRALSLKLFPKFFRADMELQDFSEQAQHGRALSSLAGRADIGVDNRVAAITVAGM